MNEDNSYVNNVKAEQTPLIRGGTRENVNTEKIRDERNNLRNALIGAQESAIIQCLLEAIDPARGETQTDKRMVFFRDAMLTKSFFSECFDLATNGSDSVRY